MGGKLGQRQGVEGDHAGERGGLLRDEGSHVEHTGIVDQNIHINAAGGCLVEQRPGRAGFGQVCRHDLRRDTVAGGQIGGDACQLCLAAGDQHQIKAAFGEFARQRLADAGGCPGDEHPFTAGTARRRGLFAAGRSFSRRFA